MKKLHLLTYFVLITFLNAFAQQKKCGTTIMLNQAILTNPEVEQILQEGNKHAEQYAKKNRGNKNNANYVIPVVVHLIYGESMERLDKVVIEKGIEELNEDFQKKRADTINIAPEFKGIAANCQMEFRLARIDPDGNCTEGITQTISDLTYEADNNVKDLIYWPRENYLNIYIVEDIIWNVGGVRDTSRNSKRTKF